MSEDSRTRPNPRGRTIFLPSIQHTGLWFVRKLLLASPDVVGMVEWHEIRAGRLWAPWGGIVLAHTHIGAESIGPDYLRRKCTTGSIMELNMLCESLPTIMPMRDPLAAVVSRFCRDPLTDADDIVRGFLMAKQLPAVPYFVPVDQPRERGMIAAAGMYRIAGIEPPADKTVLKQWARENETPAHPLRSAYAAGDVDAVRKAAPRSFELFERVAGELKPWLQCLGYERLPWF